MPASASGSEAFDKLKAVLQEHAPALKVAKDEPRFYMLHGKVIVRRKKGHLFGAVLAMDDIVKFYLTELIWHHDLRGQISPELLKHDQNITCFVFQANGADLTDSLLTELAGLVKTCLDRMKQQGRA